MAILSLPLAWVAKERSQSHHEQQIAEQLREQGSNVVMLYGPFDSMKLILQDKPQGWWRDLARHVLGERIFFVEVPADFHDLESLGGLKSIEGLVVTSEQVTDVSALANLSTLKHLVFKSAQLSHIEPLAGLTNLEWISVRSTSVSDLSPLKEMTKLRVVVVQDTPVTREQIESLHAALPNCKILHDPFP